MVACTFSPSSWEAEEDRHTGVRGQPGAQSKFQEIRAKQRNPVLKKRKRKEERERGREGRGQ